MIRQAWIGWINTFVVQGDKISYNKKMKYDLIILSLVVLACAQGQTVLLTPILPASAFQNEFYQVRFRVRNLVGARFQFRNVPSFFTASSEGLLSGVPTKQGLYAIEVMYYNETFRESKQVIIDVRRGTKLTNYNSEGETQQQAQTQSKLKPKEQYLFTYNQNDELNIEVNITGGQPPYTFESIYIPTELQFNNKTGTIAGRFRKFGDYIIGVKVSDAKNKQIHILIKITIVIRNTTTPKFIFFQRSMLQVKFELKQLPNNSSNTLPPNTAGGSVKIPSNDQSKHSASQDPAQPSTPNQSENPQTSAINQSIGVPHTQTPPTRPINQPTVSQKERLSQPVIPQTIANQAQSSAKQQIISTQNIIKKNITAEADMEKIQRQKDRLNKRLQQSKEELKFCYNNVEVARSTVQNLLNTYNEQFSKVDYLKNQHQQLRTRSQRASTDLQEKLARLKTLQVDRMLAERQANRSQMSYDNVNFAYNGSLANIRKNLQDIQAKQHLIDSYKRDLDNSYKTLDQAIALNAKLEKEKQDLNQDLIKAMGLFSKANSTKTVAFGGCQNFTFHQKSVGVGQVKKVMDKIYLLTNNQFITFGDCSQSVRARPGDIIEWNGYLFDGGVSATFIKKLK